MKICHNGQTCKRQFSQIAKVLNWLETRIRFCFEDSPGRITWCCIHCLYQLLQWMHEWGRNYISVLNVLTQWFEFARVLQNLQLVMMMMMQLVKVYMVIIGQAGDSKLNLLAIWTAFRLGPMRRDPFQITQTQWWRYTPFVWTRPSSIPNMDLSATKQKASSVLDYIIFWVHWD